MEKNNKNDESAVNILLNISSDLFIDQINFKTDNKFQKFKTECNKAGTTEEALANADKLGFKTNMFAEHPFISNKKIPIYFANFVLMDYGTGAIFGCPAHDQRDFEFAIKYNLEIIKVVSDGKNAELKDRTRRARRRFSRPARAATSMSRGY